MRLARSRAPMLVALALALPACGGRPAAPEPGGAEAERPGRVETVWTDAHEWFVEHPLLVAGEAAELAAHLTSLEGFRPVGSGRLEVALVDASGAVRQRVVAETVARPGIFLPELTPERSSDARLRLTYTSPSGATDEVGWQVRIAPTPEQLAAAPPEPEGIAFLKEQQWRIPFATLAVAAMPVRDSIDLPAGIEAHPRGTAVVAAPASGLFRAPESGLVTPGAAVDKGQVLGHLLAPPGSTEGWHTLAADLVEARNRVDEAEREHGRAERLVAAGAVPERRLHEAEVALENARARLRSAEARAAAGQVEGPPGDEGLVVRSPMTGVVAEVRITDGEPVDPERALFRLIDLDLLVARVEVPEPELHELLAARRRGVLPALAFRPATGDPASPARDLHSGDWLSGARLLELGTEVDPTSRTAAVRYEVRGAGDRLRPGMSTVARLQMGAPREALAVPGSAVIDLAGVQVVYVQLGGETFQERAVRTGTRDGELIEIVSGLAPGDRIVTQGAYQVRLAALSPDAAPAHSH